MVFKGFARITDTGFRPFRAMELMTLDVAGLHPALRYLALSGLNPIVTNITGISNIKKNDPFGDDQLIKQS